MNLVLTDTPAAADTDLLTDLLVIHNEEKAGLSKRQPLAVLLKHDDKTMGGLIGATSRNYLHVAILVVDESLRGKDWGTRLLEAAEAAAKKRGCTNVYLDTFSFQALPFYEKMGYQIFGILPDFPPGHQRFFLTKRL